MADDLKMEEAPESVIKIFVASIDETTELLNRFLEEEDIQNYTIKVHGLKSTARVVNEITVSKMAEELEMAGKRGDFDAIRKGHPALMEEYHKCRDLLERSRERKLSGTSAEFRDAYLTIAEYASAGDSTGIMAVFEALEEFDVPENDAAVFKKIREAVENRDFAKVRDIVERIL